ncbi:hypothetical protein K7957_11730 [Sphingomonas yunnanensis]|uniref:hypothetical protein n=1 Tax=Sphingomonas yunnanensis TaxID=310400 RepID=UPI001CA6E27C|nr:hypothetical protein [Sphingomonas yunnanensis]MBY9063603.1 hypothetical protein [Sphingomonas yunnanensis]
MATTVTRMRDRALAERRELAEVVIGGIVVEARARQDRRRPPARKEDVPSRTTYPAPAAITPMPTVRVPPSTVAQMEDPASMRSAAVLAAALRPLETDEAGDVRPIDRIKEGMLRTDRHRSPPLSYRRLPQMRGRQALEPAWSGRPSHAR